MTNENVYIYDHETGTEITREMTDEEQAERNANVEIAQAKRLADQKALLQVEADKAALLAKLGITADEAKLLLS
jgi:hypothetical protein